MLRIWKWYQSCLSLHPVKTQIISSGFLWGIGDVAAQYITHSTAKKRLQYHKCIPMVYGQNGFNDAMDDDNEFKVNWKRVAVTSMFGFGFVGPVGHFWYEELDKFIKMRLLLRPKSARFVAAKVAMDGLIFGPFDLFVFFTYMGFSAGKSTAQVKEDVKRDFLPALILEGGVWPIVQVANFRYVPVRYQLLYVNIFCLLDSAFLSWIEQQKDAPWKQRFTSFTSMKEGGGQGRL
ncbi:PXMP2/4 family protein 2 [Gossypium arboreum]|uniref:PXMP2/4 family protein 2 n=1 Tax=Gossypium arboreum TaxID=29729 RepID=A0A0B0NB08_GOSAR|nr:PXMP2/4 family protein 2 [Gossypium arboreum]